MSNTNEIPVKFCGAFSEQNRSGEDFVQVQQFGSFRYFAIFDGHGDSSMKSCLKCERFNSNHVGAYTRKHLHERISSKFKEINTSSEDTVIQAIKEVFLAFDEEMEKNNVLYGATCSMVLIDDENNLVYQVNLGDSRSFIFRDDSDHTIISSTNDHKPEDEEEHKRILAASGYVSWGRINGEIAVSRSFGDFDFKYTTQSSYDPVNGMISAVPDITVIPKQSGNMLILASDGLFERKETTFITVAQAFSDCREEAQMIIDNYEKFIFDAGIEDYLEETLGKKPTFIDTQNYYEKFERVTDDESSVFDRTSFLDKLEDIWAALIVCKLSIRDDDCSVIIVRI
ncbi:Protein phosphatase 2C [uncultured virus]|nr:Protein phosphatase 2C [uncultured virus]